MPNVQMMLNRLRKIRAIILYGDTTEARWWMRQYEQCRRERDALQVANAQLSNNAKISGESFSRLFDDWQRAEFRASCLEGDIRALKDRQLHATPKRDARGRFVR